MTLTTPYSATFYVGDGERKEFPYLFEEVSESFIDVVVYNSLTGQSSTPTYIVDTDQKQVIFGDDTPAPTADETVCIYRNTPNVQDVAFRTLHGYDAKTLENILSKIVAMIQEMKSNYFSTQVLQGDPWQLDLLTSGDDGATVNIDYAAKKLVKGLYFKITSGNLQVSADGSNYITMPKSTDVAEFRQQQTEMPDHTYQYRLQYRVGNTWYNAESNAEATADAALQVAEEARDIASDAKDIAQDAKDIADTFDGRLTQAELDASDAKNTVDSHVLDYNNPHQVTASQVGLGNVDNTADLDKPISTATQSALDLKMPISTKYGASISLTIDSSTYVLTAQLKDQDNNNLGTAQTIDLPLESVVVSGSYDTDTKEVILVLENGSEIRFSVADLISGLQSEITAQNPLNADLVDDSTSAHKFVTATEKTNWNNHIASTNNPHQVTKAQVGLGNVDNTSDLNKPISTATQTALDLKADKSTTYTKTETDTLLGAKQDIISDLSTIRSNAQAGKAASDTIATYGDIVTHDVAEFATAAQGALADSALQPGDNISELVNDVGYLTQHQTLADLGITATASEINVLDGITATTTELNYTDGVTSNIQTQLNAKAVDTDVVHKTGNETISGTKTFNETLQLKSNLSFRSYGSSDSGRLQFRAQPSDNVIRGTVAITDGYSTAGSGYNGFIAQMVARAGSTTSDPFNTIRVSNKGVEYIQEANDGTITGQYIIVDNYGLIPSARLAASGSVGQVLTKTTTGQDWETLATVATTGSYSDLSGTPTIGNATLTIQKNSVAVDTFTANATVDKSINITVPVSAADVNALPDSTKYVANASMTINNTTYVVTLQLKDQDGNNIGTAQTIDLPLESVVVGGSYDSTNKKIVLTLKDGSTIDIPVGDLVAGLQTEITSTNKLDADLVDDSTSTNKFVTASDKTTWNGKQDAISDLATIRSNASSGASAYTTIQGYGDIVTHSASEFATSAQGAKADTALQSGDNVSELVNDAGYLTGINSSDVTTALGYTPYSDANPNGYTSNVGTVTSVNSVSPDGSGNVSLTIPTVNNPTITITQGGVTKGSFSLNQATGDTIALDAGGGGGSADIDNLTITENADQEIQAVAVIDQNTGIAKTWTGTMAEYDAIVTKDPETEYIITDDIGGSATEIGQITEALNDKVDKGHQVIAFQEPTSANNYTWYRKYADGWVEQGGCKNPSGSTGLIINLPVAMRDRLYTAIVVPAGSDNDTGGWADLQAALCGAESTYTYGKAETSFRISCASSVGINWQVSGMAA